MRFYRLDEVPVSRDDTVFKESPLGNAIAVLFTFGIAITAFYCAIANWPHGNPTVFLYFFGGFFGLMGLFPLSNLRASLKSSNWLLRCQLSGMVVKYRAYENWKLPADTLQAVGFDYGEIAWAKLVKEHRKSPSGDHRGGTQLEFLTYIDLGLANPTTTELEANLQAERNLRPNGRVIFLDFPVQVLPGGVVEIRWQSGIRPPAKKALGILGRRVKILETEHRQTDLTYRTGTNADDAKAKILALAKNGDEMAAVKLAQQVYGYNLTKATEFVDSLTGQTGD